MMTSFTGAEKKVIAVCATLICASLIWLAIANSSTPRVEADARARPGVVDAAASVVTAAHQSSAEDARADERPTFDHATIVKGEAIYQEILKRYPALTMYAFCGLTGEHPRLTVDVPESMWKRMTTAERNALAIYVRSELATVRADPSRYSLTPSKAPVWPVHRKAFENICDDCWEIHVGRYDRGTRSLDDSTERTAMRGGSS